MHECSHIEAIEREAQALLENLWGLIQEFENMLDDEQGRS